jgi:diguanylate cyclase (GGDEF)-like protein/PAS domain S-box-containing protein
LNEKLAGPSSRLRETRPYHPNALSVLKEHQVLMLPSPRCEQVLAAILESAEEAIIGIALDGSIELWSRGAERLYGFTAAEVTGLALVSLLPIYEGPSLQTVLEATREGKLSGSETVERLHKMGAKLNVQVRRMAMRDERGVITGILEIGRATRQKTEDTPSETQLRLLVEQMPVLLWTTDQSLRITSNWGSGLQHSDVHAGDLVGRTVSEYLKCSNANMAPMAHHYAALRGESAHFEYKRKDRILEIHLEPLRAPSGETIGCIGVGLDITVRKRSEELIRYQATHDALTALANYREFMDTLERELRRAERGHHSFTVLLLDLDDLKRINDRLGHLAGNGALKRLARVIKEQCRATDLAARYGGDEFAVVLIESDLCMAQQVAERIETHVREDKEEPPISVCSGMAIYPADGRTAQDLLEAADRQLYGQKRLLRSRNAAAG